MINEAYESYNKSHKGEFSNADKFRESISEYAMATDVMVAIFMMKQSQKHFMTIM